MTDAQMWAHQFMEHEWHTKRFECSHCEYMDVASVRFLAHMGRTHGIYIDNVDEFWTTCVRFRGFQECPAPDCGFVTATREALRRHETGHADQQENVRIEGRVRRVGDDPRSSLVFEGRRTPPPRSPPPTYERAQSEARTTPSEADRDELDEFRINLVDDSLPGVGTLVANAMRDRRQREQQLRYGPVFDLVMSLPNPPRAARPVRLPVEKTVRSRTACRFICEFNRSDGPDVHLCWFKLPEPGVTGAIVRMDRGRAPLVHRVLCRVRIDRHDGEPMTPRARAGDGFYTLWPDQSQMLDVKTRPWHVRHKIQVDRLPPSGPAVFIDPVEQDVYDLWIVQAPCAHRD